MINLLLANCHGTERMQTIGDTDNKDFGCILLLVASLALVPSAVDVASVNITNNINY